jgi:hypothetical protein
MLIAIFRNRTAFLNLQAVFIYSLSRYSSGSGSGGSSSSSSSSSSSNSSSSSSSSSVLKSIKVYVYRHNIDASTKKNILKICSYNCVLKTAITWV